ncbi:MAG TPA: oligosaccharide flippase family protein, partial [Rhodopila sp.]|nr:oligosaccharide flippase family protein [Rhodopila sp.]
TVLLGLLLQSYWALVCGIAVTRVAQVGLSYAVHPYRPRLSTAHWTEIAGFSFWTWAASLAAIVWCRCDPFVIGPAIGTAPLGIYLLASEIASLPVTELIAPAAEVLLGGFSLARRSGGDAISAALPVATSLLFAIMPLMLAICGASGFIVAALLGPGWSGAAPLIAIAVWIGLFSPYAYVASTALVSANRVRSVFVSNLVSSAIKLGGLAATVAWTTDLGLITAVTVVIVGLEACILVACLLRSGDTPSREAAGGLGRLLVSSAIIAALIYGTGLAGRSVALPVWQALLAGGAIGTALIGGFGALAYAVWRLAGRPQGPETGAAGLLGPVIGSLSARLPRSGAAAARRATR